jgi:hypothetical protein
VICYTQGGKLKGGTGQALKIAQKYRVPVFNLGEFEHTPDMIAPKLKEFLRGTAIDADDLSL